MPDYLQDLIDRSQAYQDPATYPIDTSAPAPWDDQTSKKKKTRAAGESIFGDIPSSPNRAGGNQWLPPGVQPSTTVGPAIAQAAGAVRDWFANPANPSYGASPMSVGAPPQQQGVPDLTAQQPVPFQNVPGLPQGFPGQTSREVDGQPAAGAEKFTPTQKPAVPYQEGGGLPPPIRARPPPPPRSAVMDTSDQTAAGQAGQQAGLLGPLGNIGNWLGQHSNALLAMGAGLMGAPNVWQGLGRGFSYMGPAAQQDIKMQTLMSGQNAAFNALIAAGVPRDLAMAGATDKDVMKQLMEGYVTGNKYTIHNVEKTNSWGEKTQTPIAVNERDPSDAYYVETGQPVNPSVSRNKGPQVGTVIQGQNGQPIMVPHTESGGTPSPTTGVPGQAQSQFYAPGITDENYNENLAPDQYLAQFTPGVQQQIRDRVNGLMPASTASGRMSGPAQRITRASELYGAMIGKPMDIASVAQRREWATSLANTKSGVGMQIKGLQQGLDHFVDIVDTAEKMGLSGGMGLERVARGVNRLKAEGTGQSDLIAHAGTIGQSLAGEIGKLNSGSAGGGVHEREAAKAYLADPYHSRNSAAGAFEGTLALLEGGIDALEQKRDSLFGSDPKNWPKGSDFLGEKEQQQIQHVRDVIARLRKGESAPAAAPAAPRFEPGKKYTVDAYGNVVSGQ